MFWGLIMEPQKRYTQVVQRPFHISMAALDVFSADDNQTQLILTFEERNYLLCTLQKGNIIQTSLNLNFDVGDEVVFAVNGHSNIHLSGYLCNNFDNQETMPFMQSTTKNKRMLEKDKIQTPTKKSKLAELLNENYNSEEDESFKLPESAEEEEDEDEIDSNLEEEEEEEDSDGVAEQMEEEVDISEEEFSLDENMSSDEEQKEEIKKKKVEGKPKINGTATKKQKQLQKEKSSNSEKPTAKKEKKSSNVQSPSSQKRTVEGGVVIQDLKVGNGPAVKPGKIVQVYYEGRLKQNNKLFDQSNKGAGFKFRLGKQEVIKGWDIGVAGMQVGGKRRIVCPPQMAYGQKGSPPVIPPNSTLIFDVELKNVM